MHSARLSSIATAVVVNRESPPTVMCKLMRADFDLHWRRPSCSTEWQAARTLGSRLPQQQQITAETTAGAQTAATRWNPHADLDLQWWHLHILDIFNFPSAKVWLFCFWGKCPDLTAFGTTEVSRIQNPGRRLLRSNCNGCNETG